MVVEVVKVGIKINPNPTLARVKEYGERKNLFLPNSNLLLPLEFILVTILDSIKLASLTLPK